MRTVVAIILIIAGSSLLSGCNGAIDLNAWVNRTEKLKQDAQSEGAVTPYREKQYSTLKSYFYEVEQIALSVKNDETFRNGFHKALLTADFADVCRRVFIQRDEWNLMMKRCHKNRYFLCSEEVRAYPEMVRALREGMTAELQTKFDELKECSGAWEE